MTRTCNEIESRAIRIGRNSRNIGVLLIAGLHGCEWGSSDILIQFIYRLLNAFYRNENIELGATQYTSELIQTLVDSLNIIIFPNVNPDGKIFSQNHYPRDREWRKNRSGGNLEDPDPRTVGVDLNGNFNFLWDYRTLIGEDQFVEQFENLENSYYKGIEPESEIETQNVIRLLNSDAHLGYFLDIHCYGRLIMYPWAVAMNEIIPVNDIEIMNFNNEEWDGARLQTNYREFIPDCDARRFEQWANDMSNAIFQVGNRRYNVGQVYTTSGFRRPFTGSVLDYVYSLNFPNRFPNLDVQPRIQRERRIFPFCIEFGITDFQPPYHGSRTTVESMDDNISDVLAALYEFFYLIAVAERLENPVRREFRRFRT